MKSMSERKDWEEKDKESVSKFLDNCYAEGLGEMRIRKYKYTLLNLSRMLGMDFYKATRSNIEKLVADINKSEYKEWTKHDYKVCIKKFWKWLKKCEPDEYPEEVKWIKTTANNGKNYLPEELLTMEEVKRLIDAADNLRDKTLIMTLYESAARAAELLTLKVKHVTFDKDGVVLRLEGKTGSRRVRCVMASSYLSNWLQNHPNHKPDYPLWPSKYKNSGAAMKYGALNKILKDIAEKAGVTKPVRPHAFRHARLTALSKKLSDSQLKQFAGWTQGSEMASVYVHLSGKDVDDAILEMYGKKDHQQEKEAYKSVECPRCHQENEVTNKHCRFCGHGLSDEAVRKAMEEEKDVRQELKEVREYIQNIDKHMNEAIERRMSEMGLMGVRG